MVPNLDVAPVYVLGEDLGPTEALEAPVVAEAAEAIETHAAPDLLQAA